MKYPLNSKNNPNGPVPYRCPACGNETGKNFITLNGGILPSEDESTFLSITSHHNDYPNGLTIISDLKGWQYEFYFCNSKCIRSFFNKIVDDFEKKNAI